MSQQLADERTLRAVVESQLTALTAEHSLLESRVSEETARTQQLHSEKAVVQQSLDTLQHSHDSLRHQHDTFQQQHQHCSGDSAVTQQLQKEISVLHIQVQHELSKHQSIERKLEQANIEVSNLRQQHDALQQQCAADKQAKDKVVALNRRLRKRIEKLEEEMDGT